jgi:hypothetical protein
MQKFAAKASREIIQIKDVTFIIQCLECFSIPPQTYRKSLRCSSICGIRVMKHGRGNLYPFAIRFNASKVKLKAWANPAT